MICPVCRRGTRAGADCACVVDEALVGPVGIAAYLRECDRVPEGNSCAATWCRTRVYRTGDFCKVHKCDVPSDGPELAPLAGMFSKRE